LESQSAIETLQKDHAALKSQNASLKPLSSAEASLRKELEKWKREFSREKDSREAFEKAFRQKERQVRDLKEALEDRSREYEEEDDVRHGRRQTEMNRLREELDLEREEREDMLAEYQVLRNKLDEALDQIEDRDEEIYRLKGGERSASRLSGGSGWGSTSRKRYHRDRDDEGSEHGSSGGARGKKDMSRLERKLAELEKASDLLFLYVMIFSKLGDLTGERRLKITDQCSSNDALFQK
jgi:chromosome segregation ATPase